VCTLKKGQKKRGEKGGSQHEERIQEEPTRVYQVGVGGGGERGP